MAAPRSKISRLPWKIRNTICEMLSDGRRGADVCAYANATKEWRALRKADPALIDITEQNVSQWRTSGYKEWQAERARHERLRTATETAHHIAEATGGNPASVGSRILSGRLTEFLETVDLDTDGVMSLAKILNDLRKGENDSQRLALDRQKAELQAEALELERAKFRRTTCELFLKWYRDQKALSIADSDGSNDEKIQALLAYMEEQEKMDT